MKKYTEIKIVCISDTHTKHTQLKTVPTGDILIHSGDITNVGEINSLYSFLSWFDKFEHQHKIFIAGNHDWCFEKFHYNATSCYQILKKFPNITYLHHQSHYISSYDLNVFGSPYTPYFFDWAFNIPRGKLFAYWDQIPTNTDVLITHGPCFNILDKNLNGEACGDVELLNAVKKLDNLKLHVFGHIHTKQYDLQTKKKFGVKFVNASVLDEHYELLNEPVVVKMRRDFNDVNSKWVVSR